MTTELSAVRVALDLLYAPSRVRIAKSRPLPARVAFLLRVAARDAEAEDEAARASERSCEAVHAAALFFIEQVLFDAESDSYRILGVDRSASMVELRRNMALLLRVYHPDVERDADRASSVAKVTQAWDNLKTPERRIRYDETHPPIELGMSKTSASRSKIGSKSESKGRIGWERRSAGRRETRDPAEKFIRLLHAILVLFGLGRRRVRRRS